MTAPKHHISEAKPDMSLLPLDLLEEMLCPAYQEGLKKYYRESWRLGFPSSVMMAAALRHLSKFYYEREEFDQDTLKAYEIKKHHLGAVLFCIISMYNSVKNYPELDDRPGIVPPPQKETKFGDVVEVFRAWIKNVFKRR